MRTIKIRSGGEAYILENTEECPEGAVCFLETEWLYTQRLARDKQRDPEAHRAFWETVLQKKRDVPGYIIFMDFPLSLPETKREPGFFPGAKICAEILDTLRGRNGKKED